MAFCLQYLKKAPCEDNAFAQYGTFCHELLEQWAKGEIPALALASEYEEKYDSAITKSFPPFPKGMPLKYYEAGKEYFESFTGFGDYRILSVEERFEINIQGYQFVGVADLVLEDPSDGEIIVIDHKSKSMSAMKKELDTYRKQLYTYAAFVHQKFGKYPKKLVFNMFREPTLIEEDFSMDSYNQTMDWIVDTIDSIILESNWRVSPSSFYCRFVCSVFDSCPARDAVLHPQKKGK